MQRLARDAEEEPTVTFHAHSSARQTISVLTVAAALTLLPAGSAGAVTGAGGVSGAAGSAGVATVPPTGGAPIGGLAPTRRHRQRTLTPPSKRSHGKWLSQVTITEYWPAPERWFSGALVRAPGLSSPHRIDWLYSATGVSMEGEGIGLDGRMYHINALGDGGWVTVSGTPTSPSDGWSAGPPYWRAGGYWRNRSGGVTFPVASGGWSAGRGRHYVALRGVTFAAGASLPLRFLQSIAVDPHVIPLESRVYIPAYKHDGHGGWFVAQDTGGAIGGRHVDVYRPPPVSPHASGQYLTGQRIYVIKPRR